jgi:predicted nucleic-acid-binding protein
MRAIDTNIVVRFLVGDDSNQSPKARALVESGDLFVPVTVMLEAEWVLRSVYGHEGPRVAAALRAFAGLPGVSVEAPERLAAALDRTEAGMDFADALHLGGADSCDAFLTFDRRFVKAASRMGIKIVIQVEGG